MHRFFVPEDWIQQDNVTITGEPLRQIGYVLRLKPTDRIIVLDNSGREFEPFRQARAEDQAERSADKHSKDIDQRTRHHFSIIIGIRKGRNRPSSLFCQCCVFSACLIFSQLEQE